MARTDAHRPYYVLEVDEPHLFTEHHRHWNGICDLIPGEAGAWGINRDRCYRSYRGLKRFCNCSWCGGGFVGARRRRWVRHVTRQLINNALKAGDWEDVDIWPRRWMAF